MREELLNAVRCIDYLERFEIRTYAKAYKEYTQTYGPVILEAIRGKGEEAELRAMAEDFLDALEAIWKAERFWNRSVTRVNHKQMLVVYLSPMLVGMEDPSCARLAELLREGWAARRPKDIYEIADYKSIRKGFHNVILGVDLDSLRRRYDDEDEIS